MLDWIVERLWAAVTFVPALLVAEDSPELHAHPGDVRNVADRTHRVRHCDAIMSAMSSSESSS